MLFVASLLLCGALFSQGRITVSGTVENKTGAMSGVSVTISGNDRGTLTDSLGHFRIVVPGENTILSFSFAGYAIQNIKVGTQRTLHVKLEQEDKLLDEVIVIGYGTARKKDLTGSTASVKGSEIAQIPVTTAAQAITGKMAGVNVVTQSGAPGADINILVRGGTSITQSNQPLYVVDGFQMENGLRNIDVNDIATIDVMKDASATAIYGARGSNGVILITTKSGKAGKTQINYNAYMSYEKLGSKLAMLNAEQYVDYQYEFQTLAGRPDKWTKNFGGDVTDPNFYTGAANYIKTNYGSRPTIDWQDVVFGGTALLKNHSLSVSGGNDKTKVLLSGNYTGQDGLIANHNFDKFNLRAKLNHKVSDRVRVDFNTNFNNTRIDGGGSLGGQLKLSLLQPATGGIRFTDEQLIGTDVSEEMQADDSQYDIYNPIITNEAVTKSKFTRQYTANAGIEIDVLKNLTWRSAGSYMWQQERTDNWDDGRTRNAQTTYGGPWGSRDNAEKFSWQITNTLTWKKNFGLHGVTALLGQETYYSESMFLKNTYSGFDADNFGLNDVAAASTLYSKSSSKGRYGMVSGFGRVMYNYADRYMLTATFRGDGVSKFAVGHQWGGLPSMSAAWRISDERFMRNIRSINQLKLRAGYGTTGNCDIDDYMYVTSYGGSFYAINNKQVNTLVPGSTLANPALKWEKTTSTNIGLDLSMFGSRINFSADFYNQQADNLLLKVQIPTSTGYTYQFQNIASIRNRGVEMVLNTRNLVGEGLRWSTDFNISFNRSKVLQLDSRKSFITSYNNNASFLIEVGKPLGQFFGYLYDGVYTTDDFTQNANGTYTLKEGVARPKGTAGVIKPGDVKYKTVKGETDANKNPVWSTEDRTVTGSAQPKFTGGITNTFTYKGFDLGVFMNFSYGNKVFNMNTQRFIGPYLPNQNTLEAMNGRFRLIDPNTGKETTDLARLAQLNPGQHASNALWSLNAPNSKVISDPIDYYLEDASFLRLNTITLGYSLPHSLLQRAKISNVRIYGTLNNIHSFTKYRGYDPEVSATSSALTRGVDDSAFPRAKSFVFGLNLTF
ncbi:TonB-dependent receptor [Filimonas effusa]|uniref:TonB-dependent receptor n=2 Tax=Filimonas effusa TaxID=2508721 RepID=A0A4Q1DDG5_9BACT|nr:TonB-dependent receptor [Filimonas effusa]